MTEPEITEPLTPTEPAVADAALTTGAAVSYSFSYSGSALDAAPNLCVLLGVSSGATWSVGANGVTMVGLASCNSGYYQSGAACVACAAGAYCPGGSGSPLLMRSCCLGRRRGP